MYVYILCTHAWMLHVHCTCTCFNNTCMCISITYGGCSVCECVCVVYCLDHWHYWNCLDTRYVYVHIHVYIYIVPVHMVYMYMPLPRVPILMREVPHSVSSTNPTPLYHYCPQSWRGWSKCWRRQSPPYWPSKTGREMCECVNAYTCTCMCIYQTFFVAFEYSIMCKQVGKAWNRSYKYTYM